MIFRIVRGTEVQQLYIKGNPLVTMNTDTYELRVDLEVEDSHEYDVVRLQFTVKDIHVDKMRKDLRVYL